MQRETIEEWLNDCFPGVVSDIVLSYKESEYHSECTTPFHELFEEGENIFLTGVGGTGKSYQLRKLNDYCQVKDIRIGLTSTTGKSAVSIGGTTIHYWSGINTGEKPVDILMKLINANPDAKKRWIETQVLVIDEVSMLGSSVLDKLNHLAKLIRKNDKPFGGMQIIFSGDFLQLKPIRDQFSFKSKVWEKLDLVYLKLNIPHRFTDMTFFRMLNRIRIGKPLNKDIRRLHERVKAYEEVDFDCDEIKPTTLFSKKVDVKEINDNELAKIPGRAYSYYAIDKGEPKVKKGKAKDLNLAKEYKKLLDKAVDQRVDLKIGAQVMLTVNLNIGSNLVNGSRGVVTHCDKDFVEVKFDDGKTVNVTTNKWIMETENVTVCREQIPLILAWAMTLHKSQGATISKVVTSISHDIFCAGMAYLALSRCRSLDSVYLIRFDPRRIYADKQALEFENEFEEC